LGREVRRAGEERSHNR
jgi:hypothetical protein